MARLSAPAGATYAPSGGDDADAIQQLLTTAATRGGGVLLAAHAAPYRLSHPLDIPTRVSLIGESPGTRLVATTAMAAMIRVDAPLPMGSRLGTVANLALDGNGLADTGIQLGACVERAFEHLSIENCRLSGLTLAGAQNNLFVAVNVEHNGHAVTEARHGGLELLAGAGNNCFVRCEFNQNGGYQAVFAGQGGSDLVFALGPSSNTFVACVFERREANTRAAIYAGEGRMNTWLRCDFSNEGPTMFEGPEDAAAACALWRFYACALSGSNKTVCVRRADRLWGMVFDGCLFETFESIADHASAERVAVLPTNQVSNVARWKVEAPSLTPALQVPGAAWDTQHLVLGDTHLWVDPDGELRYGGHAPTGPYDGRKVLSKGGRA